MAADQFPIEASQNLDVQRKVLISLIIRISIYYMIVAVSVVVLIHVFPGLVAYMPIGGLTDIASDPFSTIEQIAGATDDAAVSRPWLHEAISLTMAMAITLIAMIPVSWLYKAIHEGHDYDHSIDETALVMPAVVAGVVTVAQHSLALAFSLAGIVAGVRFRRALSDTFDTLFIFVAIGVGLAAGVGAIEIAIVITVFFNFATALICLFGDGLESKYVADKERRQLQMKNAEIEQKKRRKKKKAKKKKRLSGLDCDGVERVGVPDPAVSPQRGGEQ